MYGNAIAWRQPGKGITILMNWAVPAWLVATTRRLDSLPATKALQVLKPTGTFLQWPENGNNSRSRHDGLGNLSVTQINNLVANWNNVKHVCLFLTTPFRLLPNRAIRTMTSTQKVTLPTITLPTLKWHWADCRWGRIAITNNKSYLSISGRCQAEPFCIIKNEAGILVSSANIYSASSISIPSACQAGSYTVTITAGASLTARRSRSKFRQSLKESSWKKLRIYMLSALAALTMSAHAAIQIKWTATANETKTLYAITGNGFSINWGDSTTDSNSSHTYASAGNYTVLISGTVSVSTCAAMHQPTGISGFALTETDKTLNTLYLWETQIWNLLAWPGYRAAANQHDRRPNLHPWPESEHFSHHYWPQVMLLAHHSKCGQQLQQPWQLPMWTIVRWLPVSQCAVHCATYRAAGLSIR